MDMFRKTFAEVDLDALEWNIGEIRRAFPQNQFFCPMVKANAYGHGDVQIARALELMGVRHLGVCLIEEGLLLRNFGVKTEILVFRGFDREGARTILRYGMTPVVSTWSQLEHLEAVATHPVDLHLKFDTGMNRLGFHPDEAPRLIEKLRSHARLKPRAVLTHLFNGEDGERFDGDSAEQLRRFHQVALLFHPLGAFAHALNSAGLLSRVLIGDQGPPDHPLRLQEWGLRPGLMIYGANPLGEGKGLKLKPVMSLKSQASVLRSVAKGDGVSYNATWRAQRDSVIAVVPIGYADGYHRLLSNRAQALFNGERVPVVGNICMDYLMLDVTQVVQTQAPPADREPEVVLFGAAANGQSLSPEELARHAQTIPWEIFTSVGERVPRLYTGAKARSLHEEVSSR